MKFGNKSSVLIVLFFAILFFNSTLSAQNLKLLKEKSFNIQPGKILHVNFAGGDIKVTSWDKNEVNVKIFGNSQAEKKVEFEISETENGVVVKAKQENSSFIFNFFNSINMKAVIKVPDNFKLDLISSGGDIYLYVKNGEVNAKSSGGDISLYYFGINKGIVIFTSGGDINLEVPQNIKADVLLRSSGGDITNNFPNKSVLTITPFENESKFNGGGEKLICRTSGGDITLNGRK